MKCRICGNETDNPEYQVKELEMGMGDEFTYFRCSQCGCLQISEIPGDMSRFYPSSYYSYNSVDEYINKPVWQRWARFFRDRYCCFGKNLIGKWLDKKYPNTHWFEHVNLNTNTQILDIGCGDGKILKSFYRVGLRNLTGADPFVERDTLFNKHFNIYKKSIDQIEGQFDFILLSHSLEHMPDQQFVFEHLSRLLAPGGTVLIILPMFCQYSFETYGPYWFAWGAPRHFYLHTLDSFQRLCATFDLRICRQEFEFCPWIHMKSDRLRHEYTGQPESVSQQEANQIAWTLQKSNQSDICLHVLTH